MKVWITDRWMAPDPSTGKKTVKKKDHGNGSRWQVSHYAEDMVGTRRLVSRKFERLTDAEAFRTKVENDLRQGSYQPTALARKIFGDAAEAWLQSKKKPVESSLRRYREALDIWVLPRWGNRTLSSISRSEVDEWIGALMSGDAPFGEGRKVRGGGLSPSAVKAVWIPFNASLRHAVRLDWISKNPATGVELPKRADNEIVYLDYSEVERLSQATLEVTHRLDDSLFIELMAFAGLRSGEAVALQVQNVDVKARRIKIRRTVTVDLQGNIVFGRPKHGERRDVPIAPHLIEALTLLMAGRALSDPLLTSARGRYINMQNWRSRIWTKSLVLAELDDRGITPQGLRHTAASMAIAAGADVKVVQQMLGHADASMTLNIYAALWPDRLDEVADAMSRERAKALEPSRS